MLGGIGLLFPREGGPAAIRNPPAESGLEIFECRQ